jgi:hypothetical protein
MAGVTPIMLVMIDVIGVIMQLLRKFLDNAECFLAQDKLSYSELHLLIEAIKRLNIKEILDDFYYSLPRKTKTALKIIKAITSLNNSMFTRSWYIANPLTKDEFFKDILEVLGLTHDVEHLSSIIAEKTLMFCPDFYKKYYIDNYLNDVHDTIKAVLNDENFIVLYKQNENPAIS